MGASRTRALKWGWITAFVVAGFAIAVLAWAALWYAGRQQALPAFLQPGAPATGFAVAILTAGSLLLYALARRRPGGSVVLQILALLAGLAALLGLAGTAPCVQAEDRLLAPVWNTLTMFVGTSPDLFDEGSRCPGGAPLALQVGRMFALTTVFFAALGVALELLADRITNLRDSVATYRTLVIGADDTSLPLIDTLERQGGRAERVLVLALPDQGTGAAKAAALGAAVRAPASFNLGTGPSSPEPIPGIERYLTRSGRVTARQTWVMDPDPASALRIGEAVRTTLERHDLSALGEAPRVVVRIDDRRSADSLRARWLVEDARRAADRDGPVKVSPVMDPVCSDEVTAAEIVGRIARNYLSRGEYCLVICGDTPLAEAISAQVAVRLWEATDLAMAWRDHVGRCTATPPCSGPDLEQHPDDLLVGGRMPAEVILLAPTAAQLSRQVLTDLPHAQRMETAPRIRLVEADWRSAPNLGVDSTRGVAFVLTEALTHDESHLPARLLRLGGERDTQVWLQPVHTLSPEPSGLVDGIEVYATNCLMGGRVAEDSWTTAARHAHERYRRAMWTHDARPTRRPWWAPDPQDRVSDEVRANNLVPLRSLLSSAARLGYTWRRQPECDVATPFTPDEAESLYAAEFARWQRDQGARERSRWPGPQAQGAQERRDRAQTIETVRARLDLLAAYGYVPVRDPSGERGAPQTGGAGT